MEVTDLLGLKRLMKGDAQRKFEFIEESENSGFLDRQEMMFSYNQ